MNLIEKKKVLIYFYREGMIRLAVYSLHIIFHSQLLSNHFKYVDVNEVEESSAVIYYTTKSL